MKVAEIRKKSKTLGVNPGKRTKEQLIHEIQRAEGNPECFNREPLTCGQEACAWRKDCKPPE